MPLRVAGRDDARDDALEAARQLGQLHGSSALIAAAYPALGPGVCSKISSTRMSMAKAGQCAMLRVTRRGMPMRVEHVGERRRAARGRTRSSSSAAQAARGGRAFDLHRRVFDRHGRRRPRCGASSRCWRWSRGWSQSGGRPCRREVVVGAERRSPRQHERHAVCASTVPTRTDVPVSRQRWIALRPPDNVAGLSPI